MNQEQTLNFCKILYRQLQGFTPFSQFNPENAARIYEVPPEFINTLVVSGILERKKSNGRDLYKWIGREPSIKVVGELIPLHNKLKADNQPQTITYTRKGWTNEEIEYLRQNYPTATHEELENHLKRNFLAIQKMASKNGIRRSSIRRSFRKRIFTKEEEQYLIDNHNRLSISEMANGLGRTNIQISNKIYHLKQIDQLDQTKENTQPAPTETQVPVEVKQPIAYRPKNLIPKANGRIWSAIELKFVIDSQGRYEPAELAIILSRTAASISSRLWLINSNDPSAEKTRNTRYLAAGWTYEQLGEIFDNSTQGYSPEDIAELTGRPINDIRDALYTLEVSMGHKVNSYTQPTHTHQPQPQPPAVAQKSKTKLPTPAIAAIILIAAAIIMFYLIYQHPGWFL